MDLDSHLDISSAISGAAGRNEGQRVLVTGTTPTAGVTTFNLTYNSQTTVAPVAWDADPTLTAANIQAGLESLSSVGVGNVLVTAFPDTMIAGVPTPSFQVTFVDTLGGPIRLTSRSRWSAELARPSMSPNLLRATSAIWANTAMVLWLCLASAQIPSPGPLRSAAGFTGLRRARRFGTTGGGVNVLYGATVELASSVTIAAETLTLNGNGEGGFAAVPLRNVSGTNTWQGNVNLASNRTAIETLGNPLTDRLIINGVVSNQGFNNFGTGTTNLEAP